MPGVLPRSAARLCHMAARAKSVCMPLPLAYIKPRSTMDGDVGNDPAVESNDNVAKADAGPIGRAAGYGLEEQSTIGVGQAERECQR